MEKANLFVVGNPKSGTTALNYFLDQHPDIFMSSPKEPNYFCEDFRNESDRYYKKQLYFSIRTPERYNSLFEVDSKNYKYIGEASTNYLYSKVAAKLIYNYNPQAKIIILLRNPIDFIYSLHTQYVNETTEDEKNINKAIKLEEIRRKWKKLPSRVRCPSFVFYKERARYYEQLLRFFKLFPKENIKVIVFEEFIKDNEKIFEELLSFLKLKNYLEIEFKKLNQSKIPRSRILNNFFRNPRLTKMLKKRLSPRFYDKIKKKMMILLLKNKKRAELDLEFKKQIIESLQGNINKTSSLLEKDLNLLWLKNN